MGGCAGCMGPNRRQQNYRVNKLTQNSPIKSRLSVSQLPINRARDKIIQDHSDSKKKLGHNNLIATLINTNYDIEKSPENNQNINQNNFIRSSSNYYQSPDSYNQVYIKDSFYMDTNKERKGSSIMFSKKVTAAQEINNNSYYDENNILESKLIHQDRPFSFGAELKTTSFKKVESPRMMNDNIITTSQIYKSGFQQQPESTQLNYHKSSQSKLASYLNSESQLGNHKISSESQLINNSKMSSSQLDNYRMPSQFSKFTKKGLLNIPQLSDEESRTPQYVRQKRRQNGEDIQMTDLDHIPRKIQGVKPLNLFKYLKDLK